MLRMEKCPPVGGDTAWVSGYGLYDELSKPMQQLLEGLHCIHTSRHQYDTTIVSLPFRDTCNLLRDLILLLQDYFGDEPNRPPIDTHHPAIRTHPVTGLKSLNVNLTYCTGFAELKKAESEALLQMLNLHIHSSDDHYVRWKWDVGSIAIWDNVCFLPIMFDSLSKTDISLESNVASDNSW